MRAALPVDGFRIGLAECTIKEQCISEISGLQKYTEELRSILGALGIKEKII